MCCASAALPPLPNSSSLFPARNASAMTPATAPIAESVSGASSAARCPTLSLMRRPASASRSALLTAHPPGVQAAELERELGGQDVHLAQRLGDAVLSVEPAVEEHVAAASGARHLPAQSAGLAGGVVGLVERRVADPRREMLLLLPGLVEEAPEVVELALEQRVLHLHGQLLLHPQAVERLLLALDEPLRLVLDDPVRAPRRPGVAEQHVVLELVDDVAADAQRVDDHAVGQELDEVEAAEG